MTPKPLLSRLAAKQCLPIVPFMLVLLALGIGIAGWMTAPKKQFRLALPEKYHGLLLMPEDALTLRKAIEEFPGLLIEVAQSPEQLGDSAESKPGYQIQIFRKVLTFDYRLISSPDFCFERSIEARTLAELASRLRVDVKPLREKFDALGFTHNRSSGLFAFGESLALSRAIEALNAVPPEPQEAIRAYESAASIAMHPWYRSPRRIGPNSSYPGQDVYDHPLTALAYLRKAEELTDWRLRTDEWARVEQSIASYLIDLGCEREAAEILDEVAQVIQRLPGTSDPDTLKSRDKLASAMKHKTAYADAERRHKAARLKSISVIMHSNFGPYDWWFNNYLTDETFPIVELDKRDEDSQPSVTIHPHWPGPEHPDTLIIFSNFADSLEAQSRHTEAEEHYREVLTIRAGVLGSEHNDTLRTARELARCLHAQGKKTEALEFARLAANGWQKTLGAEHPRTLLALELVKAIEKP